MQVSQQFAVLTSYFTILISDKEEPQSKFKFNFVLYKKFYTGQVILAEIYYYSSLWNKLFCDEIFEGKTLFNKLNSRAELDLRLTKFIIYFPKNELIQT